MVILGTNAFIVESNRRMCLVKPFSSELGFAENVPIFDGVIDYAFQYINKIYIYIIRNYLYIQPCSTTQ